MLATYAKSQYEEMQVQTTPEKLVVILYDGALRFLRLGLAGIHNQDVVSQTTNLTRAQDILCHLESTLNPEAGKIASDLKSIYRFCIRRLLIANAENRAENVEEIIHLLESLREAWEHAERTVGGERQIAQQTALVGAAR
jgi:flagellar protein FliS